MIGINKVIEQLKLKEETIKEEKLEKDNKNKTLEIQSKQIFYKNKIMKSKSF